MNNNPIVRIPSECLCPESLIVISVTRMIIVVGTEILIMSLKLIVNFINAH